MTDSHTCKIDTSDELLRQTHVYIIRCALPMNSYCLTHVDIMQAEYALLTDTYFTWYSQCYLNDIHMRNLVNSLDWQVYTWYNRCTLLHDACRIQQQIHLTHTSDTWFTSELLRLTHGSSVNSYGWQMIYQWSLTSDTLFTSELLRVTDTRTWYI